MFQSVKCLLPKYKGLGLDPQHPCKKLGMVVHSPIVPVLVGEADGRMPGACC